MLSGKLRKGEPPLDYIRHVGRHDWVVGPRGLAVATCSDQDESMEPQRLSSSRKQRNGFRVLRVFLLVRACVGSRHADWHTHIGDPPNFKLRHYRIGF